MIHRLRSPSRRRRAPSSLFASAGAEALFLHGSDGRITDASDAATELFGLSPDALIGRRLMDLVAAPDQPRLLCALATLSRREAYGPVRFEVRARRLDSEGRMIEFSLARTEGGFRSIARDVTERRVADEKVKANALAVQKSAQARADTLANISHEIRTPLNAVIGFADAMHAEQFGPIENDTYKDYARIIHDSGQHLLSLINDLLDLNQAEANATTVEMAPVDLGDLVRLCADIMKLRVDQAGLSLTVDVDETLPTVRLDAKIVRQILLNLLSNALKFTEQGGIAISVRGEGRMLSVAVTDTGVGMAPDELAKVGDRFTQARREGVRGAAGSGIGLSLSKALARVHGGELTLTSTEGEGTTAVLRLPMATADDDVPAAALASSQGAERNVVSLTAWRG